jgi:murein DD-endopeptidase MepM/ murein hydrolase activator NlpD
MENNEKKTWMERMRDTYRLVIMNDETFEEIASYRLSLFNVYLLLSTIVVLTAVLVVSLVVFTPVKRYIPGYGSASGNAEILRMNKKLTAMEKELEANRTYTENFRKILVGDVMPPKEEDASEVEYADSLLKVNRIDEDEQLRQEVKLDEIRMYTQSNTSATISAKTNELPLEQLYFSPPINGEISAGFQPNKDHYGVDIIAPRNTPIKAVMDGVVIQSDWTLETGNTIGIQHANNIITFYKHNSPLLKQEGARVKAGEAIAIIGNTGTLTDGPHLHFEIWYRGKPINPVDHIIF